MIGTQKGTIILTTTHITLSGNYRANAVSTSSEAFAT